MNTATITRPQATQLYARIRTTSRYAKQDPGTPFPVSLKHCPTDGYIWEGGPGGQYRHSDLQLIQAWNETSAPLTIPMFASGESAEVVELVMGELLLQAGKGQLNHRWMRAWADKIKAQLDGIVELAIANDVDEEDDE